VKQQAHIQYASRLIPFSVPSEMNFDRRNTAPVPISRKMGANTFKTNMALVSHPLLCPPRTMERDPPCRFVGCSRR